MRFVIVGAGAVGGYFGARLVQAGHTVRFVARGAHAQALAAEGLHIESAGETETVGPLDVSSMEEAAGFEADVALVAVKFRSLEAIAPKLAACLGPEGYVVPLLNGLDSEPTVAAHVGAGRVVAAVTYMSGALRGPGRLHMDGRARAGLAPYEGDADPRVDALASCLDAAGIPAMRHGHAGRMLWQKMLWNVPFNALCALIGQPVSQVLDDPALLETAKQCMRECVAVAACEGTLLAEPMIDAMIDVTRQEYPHTVPSMLQDVRAGRPTEVDVLQGAVVRRADAHGVPVPVTRTLAALVGGLERGPREA